MVNILINHTMNLCAMEIYLYVVGIGVVSVGEEVCLGSVGENVVGDVSVGTRVGVG